MAHDILAELRKFVSPEIIFGAGARHVVAHYAQRLGARRVLLVSDEGVAAAGWTGEIQRQLETAGVTVETFTAVSPNPRAHEVMAGAERWRTAGCDVLVAVGGGSVIDCAKGIGIVASNGGDILSYEGVDQVPAPMPPLICVPTTGGTSADVSQFAIITDTARRMKAALISKSVVPDVSLVDPETLVTMDPYLTACTGMDALVHGIEAFGSNAHSPLTDLHALEAIRLVAAHLRASVEAPSDLALRGDIMLASLQAGLAFSNASLGCVHSMAHSLGGSLDLPHGECNALLLPFVLDFNFQSAPERYLQVGEALGLSVKGLGEHAARAALVRGVLELRRQCGIDGGLRVRGVHTADLGPLATTAMDDPCNATNPREPHRGDLRALYAEAM